MTGLKIWMPLMGGVLLMPLTVALYGPAEFLDTLPESEHGARRKLGTRYTSCGCDYDCRSDEYYDDYTWTNCDTCCDDTTGTCSWWGHGTTWKNKCKDCHSSCKTCRGSGYDNCLDCPRGKHHKDVSWLSSGGTCGDCATHNHCTDGEYCTGSSCADCHSSCATCEGGDSDYCDTCVSGRHKVESITTSIGTCVQCKENSHCSSGQYCNSNYQCKDCHHSCKECGGSGYDYCTECPSGQHVSYHDSYTYWGGICSECSGHNHCSTGEYCDDGDCSACHRNCKTCGGKDGHDCTSCDLNSARPHFYDGWDTGEYCFECTDDNHCGHGKHCVESSFHDYHCSGCHSTCATCDGSGSSDCKTCANGRHLYNGWGGKYCEECTDSNHCQELGTVCHNWSYQDKFYCAIPSDDSWWCQSTQKGATLALSEVTRKPHCADATYHFQLNIDVCGYSISDTLKVRLHVSDVVEIGILADAMPRWKVLLYSSGDPASSCIDVPIPGLSIPGIMGVGGSVRFCLKINNFVIDAQGTLNADLGASISAAADAVFVDYAYPIASIDLGSVSLDTNVANLPHMCAPEYCPSLSDDGYANGWPPRDFVLTQLTDELKEQVQELAQDHLPDDVKVQLEELGVIDTTDITADQLSCASRAHSTASTASNAGLYCNCSSIPNGNWQCSEPKTSAYSCSHCAECLPYLEQRQQLANKVGAGEVSGQALGEEGSSTGIAIALSATFMLGLAGGACYMRSQSKKKKDDGKSVQLSGSEQQGDTI